MRDLRDGTTLLARKGDWDLIGNMDGIGLYFLYNDNSRRSNMCYLRYTGDGGKFEDILDDLIKKYYELETDEIRFGL
jgi:hypothetical protein